MDPETSRRDAGFTFTELVVTMAVVAVVMPLVLGFAVASQRNATGTISAANAVGDARLALQDIDREVRSGAAPVRVDGSPGSDVQAFGFYTAFAPDGTLAAQPRCVQYRIVSGVLRTRSFPATSTLSPTWSSATAVVPGLTSGSSFRTDAAASSVTVDLEVRDGAGRPAAIESTLTPRNAPIATATTCGTFS